MDGPATTRYSLIAKLANRDDHRAWSDFLRLYQPLIYRYALSRGLQPVDATEVTQEVLIRVAKAIEQFDCDRSGPGFRSWLYTIARNLTIDFLRKEGRTLPTQHAAFDWQSLPSPDPEAATWFGSLFQQELFKTAARQIRLRVKEGNWKAFWLTEVQQVSVDEVASRLGMTPAAIYVARSRILKHFRIYVQENQVQEDVNTGDGLAKGWNEQDPISGGET